MPTTTATTTKPPRLVPRGISTPRSRSSQLSVGKCALSGSGGVALLLLPFTLSCRCSASRYAASPAAMTLSMIVEITSLTPRVTLSAPATPDQRAPTSIATSRMKPMCRTVGRCTLAPAAAASSAASWYWPSTPMLNSAARKPIATAIPAR